MLSSNKVDVLSSFPKTMFSTCNKERGASLLMWKIEAAKEMAWELPEREHVQVWMRENWKGGS